MTKIAFKSSLDLNFFPFIIKFFWSAKLQFTIEEKIYKSTVVDLSKGNTENFLKIYYVFSKQYHIFELWSSFATFESLKSVEFPMLKVVWNSIPKYIFFQIPRRFKLHRSYSYNLVTLQLFTVKNGEFKEARLLLSQKYKVITEVESGTKPSTVA